MTGIKGGVTDVYQKILAHDADALLDKMNGISFVVEPDRQDAITRGTLSNDDFDGEMDDASYHIESIEEKGLPIDPINAYNHMAIYLRWCMEHDLMGGEFLKEYGEVAKQVKADPASVDLRAFIQNELDSCLFFVLFDQKGRALQAITMERATAPTILPMLMTTPSASSARSGITPMSSKMKPTCSSPLMRTTTRPWQR